MKYTFDGGLLSARLHCIRKVVVSPQLAFERPDLREKALQALDELDATGLDGLRARVAELETALRIFASDAQLILDVLASGSEPGASTGYGYEHMGDYTRDVRPLCEAIIARAVLAGDANTATTEQIERIPSHKSTDPETYIQINRLNFRVQGRTLTGQQIRDLPTPVIPDDYDLWKINPARDDERVEADKVYDLRGGRFFSAPKSINAGAASRPDGTDTT
jgi:hypothetical protein